MARFQRRNHGTGHGYRLDGQKIPGVTTVLDIKSKPALTNWAARMAAEWAQDHWEQLVAQSPSDRFKALSTAHRQRVNKAAIRGTRIHALGEKLAHGQEVDVPDEYLGPVQAYARFMDRWELTMVLTEVPVCNTRYRYGGTADGVAQTPKLNDGMPFWFDIKTGSGFYRETALQIGAYRHCNLALIDGEESPLPETSEVAYGAHVGADDVEMLPVDAGETSFNAFLYLLGVWRWEQACTDDPPVGRAIWPETVGAGS